METGGAHLNVARRDRNRGALHVQEQQRQHNVANRVLRHAAHKAAIKAGRGKRLAEAVHAIAQQTTPASRLRRGSLEFQS